jgi:hypothetical protein
MSTAPPPARLPASAPPRHGRAGVLRPWQRYGFFSLARMLADNRFAVRPGRWFKAASMVFQSGLYSLMGILEEAWFGDFRRRAEVREPLFVIGHWRSGTTMLHELLSLDERHVCPNTFQVFMPGSFLSTQRWLPPLVRFMLPARRPQDDMPMGFDLPQEDEFALLWSGAPSPYVAFYFPQDRGRFFESLELDGLCGQELALWKEVHARFLAKVAYGAPGRRPVLKSPTHSCRVGPLLELYPDARFVHIVRCPLSVYQSTVKTFRNLTEFLGLSRIDGAWVEEFVFQAMPRVYRRLDQAGRLVRPDRWFEVRYEDLIADPVPRLRQMYDHLNLGGFERVEPKVRAYFAARSDYKPNRYEPAAALREEIARRLGWIFERWGYPMPG